MVCAIITMAVGADFRKAMAPGLESKRAYAKRHGYTYIEYGDEVYAKERPIAWYKIQALKHYLESTPNPAPWVFFSDADVIITNPEIKLESFIDTFPQTANFVWTLDACGHLNSGNVFYRTSEKAWCLNFITQIWSKTDYIYHPWWENAAMILVHDNQPEMRAHIHTVVNPAAFNAYVFAVPPINATTNVMDLLRDRYEPNHPWIKGDRRLYKPGDFLIHFAGVYNIKTMTKMMKYIQENPHNPDLRILGHIRETT